MSLEIEEQYDKIYRYCYFKVQNQHTAEDLTQETFLRYFTQNTYISRGKPLAYLYTIARNLCVDYFRKKQFEVPDEEKLQQKIESGEGNEKETDLDSVIALKEALSHLTEGQQELLLLRYVNQVSVEEISRITNCSRFAVYRKTKEACKELNKYLKKEDFL